MVEPENLAFYSRVIVYLASLPACSSLHRGREAGALSRASFSLQQDRTGDSVPTSRQGDPRHGRDPRPDRPDAGLRHICISIKATVGEGFSAESVAPPPWPGVS